MFDIGQNSEETRMIEFGQAGKMLFELPVLGDPGVPMGIMSAFGMFYDKVQNRTKMTDRGVASAWSFFIDVLANSYPDATMQLAQLDEKQLKDVIEHWVKKSQEMAGYDPKVR